MDVAVELRRANRQAQPLIQVVDEGVDEMVGDVVALVNEGIRAVDDLRVRVIIVELGDVGVVLPQRWTRRTDVGQERPG